MNIIGTLDEADLSFVSKQEVVDQFLAQYSKKNKNHSEGLDFKQTFPKTNSEVISILINLIQFNPYFRKKPEQLLSLPIFDDLRKDHKEWLVPPSK